MPLIVFFHVRLAGQPTIKGVALAIKKLETQNEWHKLCAIHFCCFVRGRMFCVKPIVIQRMSIPVAAWSKAWVYGRSLTGNASSNPVGGKDVCLL
jgi:hypothetical protein